LYGIKYQDVNKPNKTFHPQGLESGKIVIIEITFTAPIGLIVTIAIIVFAIVFPLIFSIWFMLTVWGRRKDIDDADLVHRGAFLLLLKNQIGF